MKLTSLAFIACIPFFQNLMCATSPPQAKPVVNQQPAPNWQDLAPRLCQTPPADFSTWERRRLALAIADQALPWLETCHQESIAAGTHAFVESEIIQGALYEESDPQPVLKQLFEQGARPTDAHLLHAVFNEQAEAIRLLAAHGANPNALDDDNPNNAQTVLNQAAASAKLHTIQALLDAGADPTIRTATSHKDGTTTPWMNAAQWAHENPDPKVRPLLERAIEERQAE